MTFPTVVMLYILNLPTGSKYKIHVVNFVFTASSKFSTPHSWDSTIHLRQNYDQPMQILNHVTEDKFGMLPGKHSEDKTKADVWADPLTNQKGWNKQFKQVIFIH